MLKILLMLAGAGLALAQPNAEPVGEVDPDQQALELARHVEEVEGVLRSASEAESVALLPLLEAPEAVIRMTAVRWLATRERTALEALAAGLADGDDLVRGVALQLLEDRISSTRLEELRKQAEGQDRAGVWQLLLQYGVHP